MKKLIILFASVLLVAAVIAVAVVATETETSGTVLSETETNEDATMENMTTAEGTAAEDEIIEAASELDDWCWDVYDSDNLVDPELLNLLYLSMTEKDMIELIGYPVDTVGCGIIGVLYNISDGRTCYIYTTNGAEWTDRTIYKIQINETDGSKNDLLFIDGTAYHKVYGINDDGDYGVLLNEVIEDVAVASNLIEADITAAESDNTDEASE